MINGNKSTLWTKTASLRTGKQCIVTKSEYRPPLHYGRTVCVLSIGEHYNVVIWSFRAFSIVFHFIKGHSLTNKICHAFCNQGSFSVTMLSLSVAIIELVALSRFKIGVSADQPALLVLATCFPAVIGPNPPKPLPDGALHKHPTGGCDACANPVIFFLY